jgi:predicted AAA+ superfamily ATPase
MSAAIEKLLERAVLVMERIERVLPQPLSEPQWGEAIAWRYRKRASGHGVLEPVRHVSDMNLADLQEIDGQKEKLQQNTLQFVKGLPANNVLLTGSRGTGKSSLIKACLNAYASQGLRLIEVDKEDLTDLPDIVDVVSGRPEKFIIFCDDLSFEDGEGGYKALKSILDGSVAASTPNVLIYATSNRRHLLPEHMKDNLTYTHTEDGEVHPGEVIEEKISWRSGCAHWVPQKLSFKHLAPKHWSGHSREVPEAAVWLISLHATMWGAWGRVLQLSDLYDWGNGRQAIAFSGRCTPPT